MSSTQIKEGQMIKYRDLEKYLVNLFTFLLGEDAESMGFSTDASERIIIERQNIAPMPDVQTIVTLRVDNYNNWRAQRYGKNHIGYDKHGNEIISELRTFDVYVNIMSKNLGDAFDAMRFIIANLQNNRYNDFVVQSGRMLGIENISTVKNLSDLENGTWTERVHVELRMNFKDTTTLAGKTIFVRTPTDLADLPNSVEITAETKK